MTAQTGIKTTQICNKCNQEKSFEEFGRDIYAKTGYRCKCKECRNLQERQNKFSNIAIRLKNNRDSFLWKRTLKKEVIDALGGKCVICGETDIDMLTPDHIKNNGAEHRRKLSKGKNRQGGGHITNLDIKRHNFPKDEYQVLCSNHNIKKEIIRRRKQVFDNLNKLKRENNVQNFNFYWDEKTQDIVFPDLK